jgi:hypothetical protein
MEAKSINLTEQGDERIRAQRNWRRCRSCRFGGDQEEEEEDEEEEGRRKKKNEEEEGKKKRPAEKTVHVAGAFGAPSDVAGPPSAPRATSDGAPTRAKYLAAPERAPRGGPARADRFPSHA